MIGSLLPETFVQVQGCGVRMVNCLLQEGMVSILAGIQYADAQARILVSEFDTFLSFTHQVQFLLILFISNSLNSVAPFPTAFINPYPGPCNKSPCLQTAFLQSFLLHLMSFPIWKCDHLT